MIVAFGITIFLPKSVVTSEAFSPTPERRAA